MNKKGFSFVEIIVAITIIILLAITVSTLHSNTKTKTLNTRTIADINTLDNGFMSYIQENQSLPDPRGNTNWFTIDTSYSEANAVSAY